VTVTARVRHNLRPYSGPHPTPFPSTTIVMSDDSGVIARRSTRLKEKSDTKKTDYIQAAVKEEEDTPPRKRARTSRVRDQKEKKTATRKRPAGKLAALLNMPLDVLYEVRAVFAPSGARRDRARADLSET
jgi:hypothetical protein